MQWHLEINFNIISKENFHIGMPHIDVLGLWCVFTSRASVGGETEWVKEKGHMVMLGRILDLSIQWLVVVVVLMEEEEDSKDGNDDDDDDDGGGVRDRPQRRLPQKGRRCLVVAP